MVIIKFLGNVRLQALEAKGEEKGGLVGRFSTAATQQNHLCCFTATPRPRHHPETQVLLLGRQPEHGSFPNILEYSSMKLEKSGLGQALKHNAWP
jgi:hypothetical protein